MVLLQSFEKDFQNKDDCGFDRQNGLHPILLKRRMHPIDATGIAITQKTQNKLSPAANLPPIEKIAATKDTGINKAAIEVSCPVVILCLTDIACM